VSSTANPDDCQLYVNSTPVAANYSHSETRIRPTGSSDYFIKALRGKSAGGGGGYAASRLKIRCLACTPP
jgi:hypothetical protein